MKKFLPLLISILFFGKISAQKNTDGSPDWVEMKSRGVNFYDIQKAFNEYFKDRDLSVKAIGYKPFKRWEYLVEPRVYPTGDMSVLGQNDANFKAFLENNPASVTSGKLVNGSSQIASTTWTAIGPLGAMTGSATNGLPRKAGRDNFITLHPTDPNTYWSGAPAGGLWKTTNNGTSWTTNTDNLTVIGCSDLVVDPTNTLVMYLATGDGDAGDTRSTGVLKTTDGGLTWAATGLTNAVSNYFLIRKMLINPSNTQIIIIASNAGIYRTTNGGTNWTQINTINAYDLEYKPGDPNTVYATSNTAFYLSVNGGTSFALISNGIPTTGANRLSVAVTTADPNYVYVLRSNTSSAFGGLYRSVGSGTAFTSMSTTPDILANSCAGTTGSGQGWYDLAIASSPLNKDEVVVGGVNIWRSIDGGGTWGVIGCWNSTVANPPYVHADIHDLEYTSTGTLYTTNDGGTYMYTGTAWTDKTGARNISQIYRIGCSALSVNKWITGHQDNGSNIYNGTTYNASYPGDGMDCFIDRTNDNNMFAATPNGGYVRSTNGGTSWGAANAGLSGNTYWVSPWKQDPTVATTIYGSRTNLWKSTNLGVSWTMLGVIPGTSTQGVVEFAIAPSNNQVIYAIHGTTGVYKTTDGGATWTAFNTGLPTASAQAEFLTIDPTDPNNAWVVFSGYSAGNKVFMTINGGTSWTNVSFNLPNLPANCIVYEPGTNDRVYVGMDVGVYYKDNSTSTWTLYNTGLPNTPIHDLEISPAAPTKLRAATYGRGVYEVDVVPSALPPSSAFTSAGAACTGVPKVFTDISTNGPTAWSWSVTPSAGVVINTASSQNPTITISTAGTYTVSMMASNSFGPGNVSSQTLVVTATPTITVTAAIQTICSGSTATITASGATTYSWNTGATTANISVSPAATTMYTAIGYNGSCISAAKVATVNVNATPTVVVNNASVCNGNSATVTASGAATYSWNTGATTSAIIVNPASTTIYTVTGTNAGCSNIKTATVTVNATPTITVVGTQTICSGSAANITASGAATYSWNTGATTNAISVAPVITTIYSATGFNGSCTSAITNATITVNQLPSIGISANNTIVCQGQAISLTGSGALTYTWNPGNITGSVASFTPAASQVYSCTGTDANGCDGNNSVSISVSPCTGMMNGAEEIGFNVYPNPAKDLLTVAVVSSKQFECSIELVDATGKIVFKQKTKFNANSSELKISMNTFANGIYYMKITTKEGNVQTLKVVKE
ncbi:MAG: T9SS type A sorting domain-containing protein [Bacteroidetes bacterium]|nr:T9SS type A sorting domain-containing protein [Bacteroidota bacterium]